MILNTRNALWIFFSQLVAWLLLVFLFLFRPLNVLLFPAVNNRPAAFTISIWLIQTLLFTNVVAYFINRKYIQDSNEISEIKVKTKKFVILNLIISVVHVILFCSLFLMIFGGEDL